MKTDSSRTKYFDGYERILNKYPERIEHMPEHVSRIRPVMLSAVAGSEHYAGEARR